MEIECRFFANFRDAVGQKTLDWEVDDGATVGDVLLALEGEFGIELLENGEIRSGLSILKNGRDVIHMDGTDTTLEPDDELSVFPPVAGGRPSTRRLLEDTTTPRRRPDESITMSWEGSDGGADR